MPRFLRNRALWAALAILALPPAASRAGEDVRRVVVSLKPLHSLVAGVMAGVAEPALLVGGAGSPHGYALRPSQARALHRASVVFWFGAELESFLAKPLLSLAPGAVVVAANELEGLTLLAPRKGGVWPENGGNAHGGGAPTQGGGAPARLGVRGQGAEPHRWLDPLNAKIMVRAIAGTLGRAFPGQRERFGANGIRLLARLDALHGELARLVRPIRRRPFVVLHDAFAYFEHRYGLNAAGAITVSPERRPGARRLARIRNHIRESGVPCVFAEPSFEPSFLRTVLAGSRARAGVLDPLGASLEPGVDLYFDLLRNIAGGLLDCLAEK